jgi:hypothetical protein
LFGEGFFCLQANPEMVKDLKIIPAGVSDSPPYLSFSKFNPASLRNALQQ